MAHTEQDDAPPAVRAAGPTADGEGLRRAYLDVLKLSLCDLVGRSTHEVMWDERGRGYKRELVGEAEARRRLDGRDWPLSALTMAGLSRLRDLQACVERVVRDEVPGDLIEAGAWRGGSSILMRATLDSLGADDRTLVVADSFRGFPEPQEGDTSADRAVEAALTGAEYFAPSVEEVQGYFERLGVRRGVEFVPGFFEETLDGLRGRPWSLIRLDADTYRATALALEALYPTLAVGGHLILDDYFHPYLPDSCRKAADEFRARYGIEDPIERIDWTAGRWRRTTDAGPAPAPPRPPSAAPPRVSRRPDAEGPPWRLPADRELHLEDELHEARARIRELEAEAVGAGRLRRRRWWRRAPRPG